MPIPPTDNLTQAALADRRQARARRARRHSPPRRPSGPGRDDRALPGSREGHIIDWLLGVCRDRQIGVLHRFALLGIGLHHRRNEPDAVAGAIGVDRPTILKAVDLGIRRGWLLTDYSGLLFTFPIERGQGNRRQSGARS